MEQDKKTYETPEIQVIELERQPQLLYATQILDGGELG